ncbi:helix-turn-helix domain-containing protein [Enterococcus sp. LJL98]
MNDKNLEKLGQTIRELRTSNDIKSVDFAKDLGVSQSYISDLENAKKKRPRIEILEKVAQYFGGSDEGMVTYLYIQFLELAGYTTERNFVVHGEKQNNKETEIRPLWELVKGLEEEENRPLENNEFMIVFKDNDGNESKIRSPFDKDSSIFDINPWLFNDLNIVTNSSKGFTQYSKVPTYYRGVKLSYDDKIKIKKVLDAIFELD